MRYQDAYLYAEEAVRELPDSYTDLFSTRFKYVFVDEYQDCDLAQRQAIDALFNSEKCTVIKIGDSDQAIYNSAESETPDWIPMEGFLPIQSSCRYGQEIADVINYLKKVTVQSPLNSSKFFVLSSKPFVTFGTNCIVYRQIALRTWNLELRTRDCPTNKGTTTEQILQNLIFLPPKQAGVLKYGGE